MIPRLSILAAAALALQLSAAPVAADTESDEAAAAAIAILGIAALAHNKHHYKDNYAPANGEATAEFERGYRDGVYGYSYDERKGTVDYAEGYQAGIRERENGTAYRRNSASGTTTPAAARQACAEAVARNFDVNMHHVHLGKSHQKSKHEYVIEASVGHQTLVCTAKDDGELVDLRGKI